MAANFALGLDRLLSSDEGIKGFYIGEVVESGTDSMGRIKVRIELLFGDNKSGIKTKDLPWINMLPSTGMFVRPEEGDLVTVVFQGSVYEGFYVGQAVSNTGTDKGKYFHLDFHNAEISGDYDGTDLRIAVYPTGAKEATATILMNGWTGEIKIMSNNSVDIHSGGTTSISSEAETQLNGNVVLDGDTLLTGSLIADLKPVPSAIPGGILNCLPVCMLLPGVPHACHTATKT